MTITLPNFAKTTLAGYLTAGMAICAGLLSVPQLLPQKYVAVIGGILTVLRVTVGHLQQDAGTTQAIVSGNALPSIVPSHELPDNPAAVPVSEVASAAANFPSPQQSKK